MTPRPQRRGAGGPAARVGALLLLLVALLGIVSVASRAGSPGGTAQERAPSTGFVDYAFTIGLVGVLISMAVTLWVIRPTGRWKETEGRAPLHLLPLAIALAVFCLFIILVFSLAGRAPARERTLSGQAIGTSAATATAAAATTGPARSYTPDFKWPAAIAVAAILTAAFVAAALIARQRAAGTRARATPADLAEELVTLVDLALDDLRAEPDPRTAVIAAYARMERALAAFGIPRRAFEAPFEYLERISPELRGSLPSAQRLVFELTHLFERAKFSPHEIDVSMKDEAIATLTALRDELQASREEEHGTAAA